MRVGQQLADRQRHLLICGASERIGQFLVAMGLRKNVPAESWHPDVDAALEWAEDDLLG